METSVYYPEIQAIEKIEKKLISIGYEPGSNDPIHKRPYEFFKKGNIVMARFYEPHDHDVGGLEGPWMNGRILAIEGSEEDVREVMKVLPQDDSRDLNEFVKQEYLKELKEIKKKLS